MTFRTATAEASAVANKAPARSAALDRPPTADRRQTHRSPRTRLANLAHTLVFAVPGILAYGVVVLVPMAMTIRDSFTNRDSFRPHTSWIGLTNYINLFHDSGFRLALTNSAILTLIVVLLPNIGGLAIAKLLDHTRFPRLNGAMRSIFFVPVVLSSVVVSVVWRSILSDDGLINHWLRSIGVSSPPGWLSDPNLALYSISFIISWQLLGFCVVVYHAGLQGIPQELNETAKLDGAGPWQQFRYVTWPLLAPAVTINTVMLLITAFKAYDQIQVITNGGPGNGTTTTIAFDIVQTNFTENKEGYAAAMATVMLIIIALVSSAVLRFLQRREVQL